MTKYELYEIPGHQVYEWLLDNAIMTEQELEKLDTMDDDELRQLALDYIK